MLSKIKIKNYKPIKDFELSLNNINVLTGVNSSGKSSFIQTILLFKETFLNNNANQVLNIAGEDFSNIINNHDYNNILSFKYVIKLNNYKKYFENLSPNISSNIIKWDKLIVDVGIKGEQPIKNNENDAAIGENNNLYIKNITITFVIKIKDEDYQDISLIINERSKKNRKNENIYEIKLFAEENLIDLLDLKNLNYLLNQIGNANIEFNKIFPVSIKSSNNNYWTDFITEDLNLSKFLSTNTNIKIPVLFNDIPLNIFKDISKNIQYFDPLRLSPINNSEYIVRKDSADIKNEKEIMHESGKNALKIFCDERDNKIEYYDYNGEYVKNNTLYQAVKYWMIDVFNLTKEIYANKFIFELGKKEKIFLYKVLFSAPNDENILSDINNVGFGISQIFPIVLEGLRAKPGSIIMCEQPEIHLHPKVQTLLSEFFISLARKGIVLVIETHSDHLINSFTYNSVKDNTNNIRDYLNIYYFEKDDNKLKPKKLYFDENGNIEEWPKDFLSNEYTEHLLKMTKIMKKIDYKQGE